MRIESLDGVRALLAIWVVLGHLAVLVGARLPVLDNPAVAVDLFMLLSGFFIAATFERLNDEHPGGTARRYFWVRRVMRIWPLYAVILTITLLALTPLEEMKQLLAQTFPPEWANKPHYHLPQYPEPSVENALWHYSLLFGLTPTWATANPLPDWSLSLEFQFYLLFPLLAVLLRRAPLALCFLSALLAFVSPKLFGYYGEPGWFGAFAQPAFLPYKLNFFLMGALAYALFGRKVPAAKESQTTAVLGLVLCLVVSGVQAALGVFGVLYLMSHGHSLAARVLAWRPIRWLGEISFSLYLVHMLVLLPVLGWLIEQPGFITMNPHLRFALACAVALPLVVLVSHLLNVLVEKPGIRLAHRWTTRPAADESSRAAAAPLNAVASPRD
jgi:peptidoglycan/LPS O-acetylase OafA/YrhL